MADATISLRPRATEVKPEALVVNVQEGKNYSATVAQIAAAVKKHLDPNGVL